MDRFFLLVDHLPGSNPSWSGSVAFGSVSLRIVDSFPPPLPSLPVPVQTALNTLRAMEDEHAWYAAVERVLEKPSSAEANTNVIVQRAVTFPQCLGVNLAGRWRWPLPGVRVTAGARCAPAKTNAADQTSSTEPNGLHDERTNGNGENGTHGSKLMWQLLVLGAAHTARTNATLSACVVRASGW